MRQRMLEAREKQQRQAEEASATAAKKKAELEGKRSETRFSQISHNQRLRMIPEDDSVSPLAPSRKTMNLDKRTSKLRPEFNPLLGASGGACYKPSGFKRPSGGG
mmetsp:Transcript_39411/g.101016  ORF Transcript_39411/g.101016 Transcript_39411/m.101016 type:complete len:105 (-) Transcript_39411:792-1106(-)